MYKFIRNNDYINILFKKMARKKIISSKINTGANITETSMVFEDRKGQNIYIDTNTINSKNQLEISFIFKNVNYLFNTTAKKSEGKWKIEKPKEIKSFYRRFLERYEIEQGEDARLCIEGNWFKIKNISSKGMAFYSDTKRFKVGESLRNAELTLKGKKMIIDLNIKNVHKEGILYIYGVEFKELEWYEFNEILSFIIFGKYKNLDHMNKYTREEIKDLYDRTGLLDMDVDIKDNYEKVIDNIKNNKHKYHFYTSLCAYNEHKLLTSTSTVRIYKNTYLAQHLAYTPETRYHPSAVKNSFSGMGEMLVNNPNFKYYLSYIDKNTKWHQSTYIKMRDYTNYKDIYELDEVKLFKFRVHTEVDYTDQLNDYCIEEQKNEDEFLNYCYKNVSKLERGCYDYSKENFFLDSTREIYQANEGFCKRILYVVKEKNVNIAYIVVDVYSEGINFYNSPDTCKFYFVTDDEKVENIMKASLKELKLVCKKYTKKYLFLITKSKKDIGIKELEMHSANCRIIGNKTATKEFVGNFDLFYS